MAHPSTSIVARRGTEARLHQLTLAASRLIHERGYESLSVNDLAANMGISVGGLYRYIKTKADLLVLACEGIYGDLRERVVEVATSDQQLAAKLRDGMRVYLEACLATQDLILLMYREYRHLPAEAQRRYQQREKAIVDLFADLIRSGIRQGTFAPANADVIAHDIVFLGHLPALKGWSFGARVRPAALVQEQIDLILGRLSPPVKAAKPRRAR